MKKIVFSISIFLIVIGIAYYGGMYALKEFKIRSEVSRFDSLNVTNELMNNIERNDFRAVSVDVGYLTLPGFPNWKKKNGTSVASHIAKYGHNLVLINNSNEDVRYVSAIIRYSKRYNLELLKIMERTERTLNKKNKAE